MPDLEQMRTGGKRALARALSAIERQADDAAVAALLDEAYGSPKAHVIGITGPPGVGKSTLADTLIRAWRSTGLTVGVVAVDPSSRISGGALLGDRARMATDPGDDGVFIRSLASRGRLGGLADLAFGSVVLMRALFDRVLVESVGVGQSEAEIAAVADTVVLCVQPGSGDSLQFMKAGIMEVPDIALVTKADVGAMAARAVADLKAALSLAGGGAEVRVLSASATTGEGMAKLVATLDDRARSMEASGMLGANRAQQAASWISSAIGAAAAQDASSLAMAQLGTQGDVKPFATQRELLTRIRVTLDQT